MEVETVKCVMVGDSYSGKSAMMNIFQTGRLTADFAPTAFENFSKRFKLNGKYVNLELIDASDHNDYEKLRPLSYPGTNVFLVCFTFESPSSVKSVTGKWCPEINHFCPSIPFILVETNMNTKDEARDKRRAKGKATAQKLGALDYLECSTVENIGVSEIFDEVLRLALNGKKEAKRKKKCIVM